MTIELEHITKEFGTKKAVDDACVKFEDGKIHALLGENGAGKTTLARIICGALIPEKGVILIYGSDNNKNIIKKIVFKNEGEAARLGIVQVHQTPLLAESLSVKQNILLGAENAPSYSENKKLLKKEINNLIQKWCPSLVQNTLVQDIGGDGRFYTSLLSALCRSPKVLILDEPGALLDWTQRRSLYSNLRELAQLGMNIIVITHSTSEAELYTDTATVMIHGKIVADYAQSKDFDRNKFGFSEKKISSISNSKNSFNANDSKKDINEAEMIFENLSCRPVSRPAIFKCSFSFKSGTITLISGMQESGLGTLENIITGMETEKISGTCKIKADAMLEGIFFNKQKKINLNIDLQKHHLTSRILRQKVLREGTSSMLAGLVPSNRTTRGSCKTISVCQMLSSYYEGNNPKQFAQEIINRTNVQTVPEDSAASLSGGMTQKLIFTRELSTPPVFAILCEPLQGLDSISAQHTCARIRSLAKNGCAVLILSASDFPESDADIVYSLNSGFLSKKKDQQK